jgi:hypothetical protein
MRSSSTSSRFNSGAGTDRRRIAAGRISFDLRLSRIPSSGTLDYTIGWALDYATRIGISRQPGKPSPA